jgi:hypothetical protein
MRLREFDEKERLTKANEKLKRYKTAAGADATAADAAGNFARGHRRFKGINAATKKQFDNDAKLAKLQEQGMAEAVDIGREWMSDTELDQYVPGQLQQEWRELLGYDRNGNPSALWANLTGGYEPDVNDPQDRANMVKVANKWFALKKIPNVKFYNVKDADDELEWLVRIGPQGVAEDSLKEFAPGGNGGESGRWYTDDQMTDIVGDGWWQDMDVSGTSIGVLDSEVPKEYMIQHAQAWLDDQGYSVQVLNCRLNDDDMDWYIEGSFQNPGFAKKGMAESNVFTDARMNAIKAGEDTFEVHGKTYHVTGDITDERQAGVAEDQLDELSKDTIRNYVRAQPARIKGPAGLATTDNRKAARIVDPEKGDIRRALDKYKDPEYGQQKPRLPEDSLAAMRRLAGVTTLPPAAATNGPRQYRHMPTAVQPR